MKFVRVCLWTFAGLLLVGTAAPVHAQGMGRGFNPSQMRQAITGRIQEQVGFTDEEWAIVEPKIWRVLGLQIDSGTGPLGSMVGQFRGRGGGGAGGGRGNVNTFISQIFNNGNPSPAMTKRQELETLVEDPDTAPNVFRVKLEEYRTAVKKVKEELTAAQADLQSVLTVRQEAELLQMGFLE
jgi:hypothetical protein